MGLFTEITSISSLFKSVYFIHSLDCEIKKILEWSILNGNTSNFHLEFTNETHLYQSLYFLLRTWLLPFVSLHTIIIGISRQNIINLNQITKTYLPLDFLTSSQFSRPFKMKIREAEKKLLRMAYRKLSTVNRPLSWIGQLL